MSLIKESLTNLILMDLSCWGTIPELTVCTKEIYIGKNPVPKLDNVLHELRNCLGRTQMPSNQERYIECLPSEERRRNIKPELQGQALASAKS